MGQVLLLQSVAKFITKWGSFFLLQSGAILLQSGAGITKRGNFITKWGRYYKMGQLLQSGA